MAPLLEYSQYVDDFRRRAARTESLPEKRKLEALAAYLEGSGCKARRAAILPRLADLQERLDGCETKGVDGVCNEFLAAVDEVLAVCRPG